MSEMEIDTVENTKPSAVLLPEETSAGTTPITTEAITMETETITPVTTPLILPHPPIPTHKGHDEKVKEPHPPNKTELTGQAGIEQMYQIYEKLNSTSDKSPLEAEYRKFLDAIHRSEKEKRLASQFIARFVEAFPNCYEDVVNAMFDLCEEHDPLIRKQVLKDLVQVSKKMLTCVPRVADAICQLMLGADTTELVNITAALTSLFHVDGKGTLIGIFGQIREGDEIVRDLAIKLLAVKVKDLSQEIATLSFQKLLFAEVRNIIKSTSEEEFAIFVDVLESTRIVKHEEGQELMMDVIYEKIGLDNDFQTDDKSLESLFVASDYALSLHGIPIERIVDFYFRKIFPRIGELQTRDDAIQVQQEIFKRAAELVLEVKNVKPEDAKDYMDITLDLALQIIPPESAYEGDIIPDTNFSHSECILFFFHELGSKLPSHLPSSANFAQIRNRLQFLGRLVLALEKCLRNDFRDHSEKKLDLTTPENKYKIVSLKVVKNLNTLIRDLFYKPPQYTTVIIPSWKPIAKISTEDKRRPSKASSLGKPSRPGRELQRYQPPGGKYSSGGSFGPYSRSGPRRVWRVRGRSGRY